MPRLPRLHVAGGHYHVILRGNHREALFGSDSDRHRLNEIVAEVLEQQGAQLHGVSIALIRSASRQRMLTPVRIVIAAQAVDQRVATLREVTAFLGRDPASLSELLARHR